jgi:hypothetical protein
MTAEQPGAAPASAEGSWPELDKLVEEIKAKRAEEQARQERQRAEALKMQQDAEQTWQSLQARACLEEMAAKLAELGVIARPVEVLPGSLSAAMEFSRLPRGETAIVRIDTAPGRNGPRTTLQVQRGTQQLAPVAITSNTNAELRHSLVEVAQKLLG